MKDTEVIATSELKQIIAKTDFLVPYINDKDKEPIWDGAVHVFSDTDKKAEHDLGRVPVQVKGRSVKKLPKDRISFEETYSNMVNYRNEGGVVYVVVKVDSDNQTKMYYVKLMPFYINKLLELSHNRKKIKFSLKLFPEDTKKIETIFTSFLQDRKKQPNSFSGHNWTIEEIVKQYDNDDWKLEFSVPVHGYDAKDLLSYLLDDNDIYLYVHHLKTEQFFAIEHIANIDVGCVVLDIPVFVKGTEYYKEVIYERHSAGDSYIKFGGCFVLKFLKEKEVVNFTYNLQGNLDVRINAIRFLISAIDEGGFEIGEERFELNREESSVDIETNKEMLGYLEKVKQMLCLIGVTCPMEIRELSKKEENFIRSLVLAFVYDKNITYQEKDIPYVATMEFANIRVALIFEKNANGSYKLYNFFDKKCGFTVDKEGKIPISQYTIFKRDDYLDISNMDLDVLKKSYMEYDSEEHITRVNLSILEMIQAFDQDNKREDLLLTAQELSKWLSETREQNSIYILNYLQCIRRQRKFENNEIKKLNELAVANSNNKSIQFGIQVLLENSRSASMYFDELDMDERNGIMSTPIYNLYQHELVGK